MLNLWITLNSYVIIAIIFHQKNSLSGTVKLTRNTSKCKFIYNGPRIVFGYAGENDLS